MEIASECEWKRERVASRTPACASRMRAFARRVNARDFLNGY